MFYRYMVGDSEIWDREQMIMYGAVLRSSEPGFHQNYLKEYVAILKKGGRLDSLNKMVKGLGTRSSISRLTGFYFFAGFVGLGFAYMENPGFAAYISIYWLFLGIGLALVSHGTSYPGQRFAKATKVIGWIWIAFFVLSVSVANRPA